MSSHGLFIKLQCIVVCIQLRHMTQKSTVSSRQNSQTTLDKAWLRGHFGQPWWHFAEAWWQILDMVIESWERREKHSGGNSSIRQEMEPVSLSAISFKSAATPCQSWFRWAGTLKRRQCSMTDMSLHINTHSSKITAEQVITQVAQMLVPQSYQCDWTWQAAPYLLYIT